MSFLARDTSLRSGEPIYLMTIARAEGVYRWTNADEEITYDGNLYTMADFTVGDFEQGAEPEGTILEIAMPNQGPIVQAILQVGDVLRGRTQVIVFTGHRDEPEAWVGFAGTVSKIRVENRTVAVLEVERFDGLLRRQIPRIVVSQKCQNVLGDHLCRVDLELFKFESTVADINVQDGRLIEIAGLTTEEGADGSRFLGGVLWRRLDLTTWIVAGRINYRYSGNWIVLLDANPSLSIGDPVKLYPGDDRHITTCKARFDNVLNFTGLMPMGNPERSILEGTGFLGFAVEENLIDQGVLPESPPTPTPTA